MSEFSKRRAKTTPSNILYEKMVESSPGNESKNTKKKSKNTRGNNSQGKTKKIKMSTKKEDDDEEDDEEQGDGSKIDFKTAIIKNYQEIKRTEGQLEEMESLCSLGAKEAFENIFQISPIQTLTDINNNIKEIIKARDWWEYGQPIGQCNNVIGRWNPDDKCYICGLGFDEDEFTPECEHILPVYQASLLLTLFKGDQHKKLLRNPKTPNEMSIKNELELEYAWAHRCCNRVKHEDSFLEFDKHDGKFKHHVSNMTYILTSIYDGKRKDKDNLQYCQTVSSKLKNDNRGKNAREKWIIKRMDIINSEKIQPICKLLNKFKEESKGFFYLLLLVNLISATNRVYLNIAFKSKTGRTFDVIAKAPITESILKTQIYFEVSTNIINGIESSEINNLGNKFIIDLTLNNILYINNGNPTQTKVNSVVDDKGKIIYKKYQKFINDLLISKIGKQNITSRSTDFVFTGILRDMMILIKQVIPEEKESNVEDMACECFKISIYSYFLYSINEFFKEKYEKVFGMNKDRLTERQQILMGNLSIFKVQIMEKIKKLIIACLNNITPDGNGQYKKTIIKMLIHVLKHNNLNEIIDITDIIASYDESIINVNIPTYLEKDNMMEKRVEYYEKYTNEEDIYEKEEDLEADISKLEFSAIQTLANLNESSTLLKELQEDDPTYIKELEKEAAEEQIAAEKEEKEAQEYIKETTNALLALKEETPPLKNQNKRSRIESQRSQILEEVEAATALIDLQTPFPLPQSLRPKRTRTQKGGENKSKRKTRKIRRNISIRF